MKNLHQALDELLAHTGLLVADGVRSPATLAMQGEHRAWLLRELGAETPIAELTPVALEQLAARRPGRAGPCTLKKRLSTLRRALVLAVRRGELAALPIFPEVLSPWRPRQRYLRTFAEYELLFRSLQLHRAEWMALCLWTAQHASDVERMTWYDVDPWVRVPWMRIRNTKNRKREGIRVKMPPALRQVLEAKWRRERPGRGDHLVQPWPSRGHTLADHARKLGLDIRNAIDLRHTGLSWAVRLRGITPAALAFAGHSSPVMMARTYAHALPIQLEELVDDLASIEEEGARAA